MDITTYIAAWYLIGLIGCLLGAYTDYKISGYIMVKDIIISLLVSWLGLFIFAYGIIYAARPIFNRISWSWLDYKVIKAPDKYREDGE